MRIFWEGNIMRKVFICSLCHKGILGGGLYLEPDTLTYRTNKLTVDPKYRNLVLPLKDIHQVTWKWIIFPVATFRMKNGEEYRLIVFNKKRFEKYYEAYCCNVNITQNT